MTMLRVTMLARLSRALRHQGVEEKVRCLEKLAFGNNVNSERQYYNDGIKLKIDAQNVMSSSLPDVTGFENTYTHDFVWKNIDKWPNKTALICSVTGKSYTYHQLRKACGRLATSFRKNNLQPGDTIAIVLPNIPEFVIVILAANEAGLRVTLINPVYTVYEIKHFLENSDAQAIITFPAKHADIRMTIEKNRLIKIPIIIVNDDTDIASIPGTIKFDDLIRDDIEEFSVSQKTGVNSEDTVLLPYSSGTTGLPKGVELSHRNIIVNICQMSDETIFPGREATGDYQEVLPVILPLYHMYGLSLTVYCYLRLGAKLIIMPKFTQNEFTRVLEKYPLTHMHLVPPIVQIMLYNEQITPRHVRSVKTILSGGAPLTQECVTRFQERFSDTILFNQGYGTTELSPVVSVSLNGPPASSGYLVPNTQMRIVGCNDENRGRNLGPGEKGEIYIRGPQVMKGYYKNPKATADTMDGEWYKTGDLGHCDEQGLLYVEERLKELIKVKGLQVAPAELEGLIQTHDKILDVGVIGVPHDKYGEIPKAFVVPKPGVKFDENELKAFVAKHLAKHKQLGYIQVVESIPKTATGKILRKKLKEM